ncbi:MAG TPA: polysaccharide biosynthesis protein, partial [Firmicutes bacterium]|nr:polysaccharide biosynthesis protein [Bacillota bacterium]
MSRYRRMIALMVTDAILVNLALWLALWLRFDGAIPGQYLDSFRLVAALIFTAISLVIFYLLGLYHRLWQYAGVDDLFSIAGAVTLATLVNAAAAYALTRGAGDLLLPRTVFAFSWLLNLLFIGGCRLSLRLFRQRWSFLLPLRSGTPVLIVGAGDAGVLVANEIKKQNQGSLYPIGFVDDSPSKQNQKLLGLPILGNREDIPQLVAEYGVQEIVIAIPSAPRNIIREIVDICQTTPVSLKILPGLYSEEGQGVVVSQIRQVQVEDLLGREPVKVDLNSMSGYLSERVVLVTGAGGSIGSELCRQIARFTPKKLVLLGHGENSIYEIHQELLADFNGLELVPVIVDIKDDPAISSVFKRYRPQVVFHAAAHKHVPLMEDNPAEAVKNNILGTWNVSRTAQRCRAETFIFISTDKAVNPTGVMGATKRVAEMITQQT